MGKVRSATPADAKVLLEIYRPYVLDSAITFETEVPSEDEFRRRVEDILASHVWLVHEEDGQVLGYAYATTFKARAAYNRSVESTIYIRQSHQRRGIGKELYRALLERVRELGIVNVVGIIALPNDASVAMHENLGFEFAGRLKDMGHKLGHWWDIGYWQLQLREP